MSTRFRELIRPGTNFEFVGKTRTWFTISLIAVVVSIAMLPLNKYVLGRGSLLNWTIDFKGGTEVVLKLEPEADVHDVRKALIEAGHDGIDVSTFDFAEAGQKKRAYLIRLPEFGAVQSDQGRKIAAAFEERFKDRGVQKARFSGDTFLARTTQEVKPEEFAALLKEHGLTVKPVEAQPQALAASGEVSAEHNYEVPVFGLDQKIETALEQKLSIKDAQVLQVDGIGAKAGSELRNNGIKSMLYAILMIMLYIALRFDFRYGPGTVAALLHDAIVVIGVFAVTWTEFSLTTVAAVMTVIGYSMNDTVVVFDRIRENEHRLKDKKLDRVINISINETLSRTILTSLTTFVTTLAMNILGTGLVKNFAFAMNVGIIVGTYSSIFIASPILLWLDQKYWSKQSTSGTRDKRSRRPRPTVESAEEGV